MREEKDNAAVFIMTPFMLLGSFTSFSLMGKHDHKELLEELNLTKDYETLYKLTKKRIWMGFSTVDYLNELKFKSILDFQPSPDKKNLLSGAR